MQPKDSDSKKPTEGFVSGGGDSDEENEEYKQKLEDLKQYVPFLEVMIQKLEKAKDQARSAQLKKMQSLYTILMDSKKRLKMETLIKCEAVLENLRGKVNKAYEDNLEMTSANVER